MTKSMLMKTLWQHYFREIVLAAVFLLNYIPTLFWLWDRWFARDSYYSHGILVPFMTGYLIWQKRDILKGQSPVSSPWGIRLVAVGIFIHLASSYLKVYFTSGLSMLVVIAGIVLFLHGEKRFKTMAFPLAFLFFMIPLPMIVITNISFQLKLFAALIATNILNHLRLPAINEGSVIIMEHAHVIVDDVCSGLRSLISLTGLGTIFAYWMKGNLIKKGLLFVSTIPIAI